MSEELQNPPVVDLDLILQPISEESPVGSDVRYSGIYDEMREARRADEKLEQGEWQTELKVADFPKVLNLGIDTLTTKSKDLQVAAWTCEALVKLHGFAGLRDGLKILAGLQEKFWDNLFPEIDEGDMESRANAISWTDIQVGLALKSAPITGVAAYSFADLEDSKRFDIPENLESLDSSAKERVNALKEQAEREHRVTSDLWRKEIAQTRRIAVEKVSFTIDECFAALTDLNRVIEEKYDRNQAPGLTAFRKSLDEVHNYVRLLLADKRIEEPDEILDEVSEDGETTEGSEGGGGKSGSSSGAINNRRDALKRLSEIADYFKRTEPHSPVSYLVQRAVRWGEMPLDSWLQDVIKDPSVLFQLRETLGVGSDSGEGFG
ncbi:MAG: type VI secretion system protein TssA [Pyrinomonadaceae bacterium]